MASEVRGLRKTKIGIVVSSKMDKTVVVRVERVFAHPQYAKVVRDSKKYYAHCDLSLSEGDKVKIQETRPLSKMKRWRVIERIN